MTDSFISTSAFQYGLVSSICFSIVFLTTANTLAYFDFVQPEWYQKRSVTPNRVRMTLDRRRWIILNAYAVCNVMFAWIVGSCAFSLARHIGWSPVEEDSLTTSVVKLGLCYFIGSEYIGWTHWTVHQIRWLNDAVHRHHHRYSYPVALCGLYASIGEMLIMNVPLAVLPPILLRANIYVTTFYSTFLAFYAAINHCGHQVIPKWIIDVSYHDLHHQAISVHFGTYWLP